MKNYILIFLLLIIMSCNNNTTNPGNNYNNNSNNNSNNNTSISADAKEVFNLVNQERVKAGLTEYKLDAKLCEAANQRAKEIVEKYDHVRPDGREWDTVLDEYGFNSGAYVRGENIVAMR